MEYNPDELINAYKKLSHGKAKISGIREAIRQADEQNDVPYQIYFREQLCYESNFYEDDLDMLVVFPEMLALYDRNPNTPLTKQGRNDHWNMTTCILWVYKWVIASTTYFYQVSKKDILNFCEDYKQRSLAAGYNLRPYYSLLYEFYVQAGEQALADKYFHLFEHTPRDRMSDCKACDQNEIVEFYLKHDEFETAVRLSKDLESGVLQCNSGRSYLRLKRHYLDYYLQKKDYETAGTYLQEILRKRASEDDITIRELHCYSYLNLSKALTTYKKNWKEWITSRYSYDLYSSAATCCIFFRELMKHRTRQTIKIAYDSTFPLYHEGNSYRIADLYDFYYAQAYDFAKKFDTRNETDAYWKKLQNMLELT